MSQLTWIDSVRDETWLPGLRAAVLLLRAGQRVVLRADAAAGEPYLAGRGLPEAAIDWLDRQGLVAAEASGATGDAWMDLRAPAVAVFGGAGSPYNHASALATMGVPWFYATGPDVAGGALDHADAFLVPGGGWRHGNGQLADLGETGTRTVVRFVDEGGGYLSSCAGSLIAMRLPKEALPANHPTKGDFTLLDVENWQPLRSDPGGHRSPGIGRVVTRLAAPRHPVALGLPERLEITHYNGPIFMEPERNAVPVVRYAGTTEEFTPSECFFGQPHPPTGDDRDRSLMAKAGRLGLPAIVAGEFGRGRIVMAGLHPEFGPDQGLDAWGRPAHLIGNAVLWLAQHGHGWDGTPPRRTRNITDADAAMIRAIDQASVAIRRLQSADRRSDGRWLTDRALRAAFGKTPSELWRSGLDALLPLVDRVAAGWDKAREVAGEARADRLAGAALHRYEPAGGPDLGAQGSVWLLEEASRLIDEAVTNLKRRDGEQAKAEHLVTRSYLSALGLLANAAQRLEAETATYRAEDDLAELQEMLVEQTTSAAD